MNGSCISRFLCCAQGCLPGSSSNFSTAQNGDGYAVMYQESPTRILCPVPHAPWTPPPLHPPHRGHQRLLIKVAPFIRSSGAHPACRRQKGHQPGGRSHLSAEGALLNIGMPNSRAPRKGSTSAPPSSGFRQRSHLGHHEDVGLHCLGCANSFPAVVMWCHIWLWICIPLDIFFLAVLFTIKI